MPTSNLTSILAPGSIAVVGASEHSHKIGAMVLKNLLGGGFPGTVFPINPRHQTVQGLPAYPSFKDLPQQVDLAIVCTPSGTVPQLVHECGEAGVRGMIILSAGFREVGQAGRQLEAQVQAAARAFPQMRLLGPNCVGLLAPHLRLNASFASGSAQPGRIALISQSGAICTAMLDWAAERNIGFSYLISIGNSLDVSFADLIDYLAVDANTDALILYVESIQGARQFMSAARACTRTKPILAYKAGRFAESSHAAASHTGALAGVDSVYQAAFERAGIVRIDDMTDMFDLAELLSTKNRPPGDRLAIITNAGGPGIMAADELLARGGNLAQLSANARARLDEFLPAYWSHGNPVDVLGDATPDIYARALSTVLDDPAFDAALAILTPQAMTDPLATAMQVTKVAQSSSKPVLVAWLGGHAMRESLKYFQAARLPTFATPQQAVRAFFHLVQYARALEISFETPHEVSTLPVAELQRFHDEFRRSLAHIGPALSEHLAKELLSTYGIPVTKREPAASAEAAVAAAQRIGYPVVMKIASPDILHKTDVGGVRLNISSKEEVIVAFQEIVQQAQTHRPAARILGVVVEEMVSDVHSLELILGAKRDPVFGPVVMVGMGGIATEVLRDNAVGLPPLNDQLARRMLAQLRIWPLLQGYRGLPGVDIHRLVEMVVHFSTLVADYPEILDIEVNPLLVSARRMVALDARALIDHSAKADGPQYHHLAIRPYPTEFVQSITLKDGASLVLRPIKPEDEQRWQAMMDRCSRESLWQRFQHVIKFTPHTSAARMCSIDYDREIAIVAEDQRDGERRIVGVARLLVDSHRESAEFAILVEDLWQGRGLGMRLTAYCLHIAEQSGFACVHAETTIGNTRMLKIFESLGFRRTYDQGTACVHVRKEALPTKRESVNG